MSSSVSFSPSAASLDQPSQVSSKSGANDLSPLLSSTSLGRDAASVSGPAELFGQLHQLKSSDPAKFKQVTADIAAKLKSAGGTAGGSDSFLSHLAEQFQSASDTGELSRLLPPQGGPPAGTYNGFGQASPLDAGSSGLDLKALFESIRSEVDSVVGKL